MGAIFKSRQVNLDPFPYVDSDSRRYDLASGKPRPEEYKPRPEFEPTRDPEPWAHRAYGDRSKFELNSFVWAPRREEFDTPVNRLLLEFRRLWVGQVDIVEQAAELAYNLGEHDYLWELREDTDYTPAEIEHARKVLERLAGWDE